MREWASHQCGEGVWHLEHQSNPPIWKDSVSVISESHTILGGFVNLPIVTVMLKESIQHQTWWGLPSFAYTEWSSIFSRRFNRWKNDICHHFYDLHLAHQNISATCRLILLFGSLCKSALSHKKKSRWWKAVAIHRLSFGDHILSYSMNFHSLLAYPCEVLKSFQSTIIILPLVLSLGKLCAKKLCWLCFSCVRMT